MNHLASRLRHEGLWARTIDMKIRSGDFRTTTRSTTLAEATNRTNVILLPVRLLGVGVTKLTREPISQGNLFEVNLHPRQVALDQTIDTIRAQFGPGSLQRGSLINRDGRDANEES